MTTNRVISLWVSIQPPLAFLVGTLILAHEVIIHQGGERPYILLVAVGLMGFAGVLKADQLLQNLGINVTIKRRGGDTPKEEGAGS